MEDFKDMAILTLSVAVLYLSLYAIYGKKAQK